jgi:hypothetical protein
MPNSVSVTNAECIHEACHSKIFGNFSDFFLAYSYIFATLSPSLWMMIILLIFSFLDDSRNKDHSGHFNRTIAE